jgi:hypothetical protein
MSKWGIVRQIYGDGGTPFCAMSLDLDEPARRAIWILHVSVMVKLIPESAFVKIEKGNALN